jgi:two-component system nitrogen regulation response regulator GlnG
MGKNVLRIDPDVMQIFEAYDWPGNVRELESLLKQALINATGTVITVDCLPELRSFQERGAGAPASDAAEERIASSPSADQLPESDLAAFVELRIDLDTKALYAESLELMERYLITRVLRETGGNQSLAAKMLGITRGSLRNKIRALRLSIDHVVTVPNVPAGST